MQQTSTQPSSSTTFFTIIEVFVDVFIAITNNHNIDHLTLVSPCFLHGIHSIFAPPHVTNHLGEDKIYQKKLSQGGGTWDTIKYILCWIIYVTKYTTQLPPKKSNENFKIIRSIIKQQQISINKCQKIAGKLQHASFGIPSSRCLFIPIQQEMPCNHPFIILKSSIKKNLSNWRSIVKKISTQPTSVLRLVQELRSCVGYSDT